MPSPPPGVGVSSCAGAYTGGDVPDFQRGEVTLSFALRNPEITDGGLPRVGWNVDQVTETGLGTTEYTDESGTQGLARAEPRGGMPAISPICCSSSGVGSIPPGAVSGREADWLVAWTKMATTGAPTEPGRYCCGFSKTCQLHHQEQTNTRGQEHFPHCCPSGSASESGIQPGHSSRHSAQLAVCHHPSNVAAHSLRVSPRVSPKRAV